MRKKIAFSEKTTKIVRKFEKFIFISIFNKKFQVPAIFLLEILLKNFKTKQKKFVIHKIKNNS